MDTRAKITLVLPGSDKRFAPDVILNDLAKKLRECELRSGTHEISISNDGSVAVDGIPQWKPRASTIEPQKPKRKAG